MRWVTRRQIRAISRGFPLVARDDHETLERAAFLYDALYAALQLESPEAPRDVSA